MAANLKPVRRLSEDAAKRRTIVVRGPYSFFLQQHHGHGDRYAGQRPVLGFLRRPRLPRQQEVHPFAAQSAAETAAKAAMEHGLKTRGSLCEGPGQGREAAIRALQAVGLEVTMIRT